MVWGTKIGKFYSSYTNYFGSFFKTFIVYFFLILYEVVLMKANKSLDCLGLFCPEPVFNTRLQLDEMKVGETLEVTADDPAAKSDIENLAKNLGAEVLESKQEDGVTRIVIKKLK
jgi:tRNA 2-thiouridine synthesizing protein A